MISYLTGLQLYLFWINFFSFALSRTVQAQDDYCSYSEALAITLLSQYTDRCSADLSACNVPECGDCLTSANGAGTSCNDGCLYTSGGHTVERSYTATYGITFVGYLLVPIVLAGTANVFTAGAEGYYLHNYNAVISDDYTTLTPEFGGACQFNFNGNDCLCEQRYCDESQTNANFYVDCSGFEGGSVIDYCVATGDFTESSPLLDIHRGVPLVACRGQLRILSHGVSLTTYRCRRERRWFHDLIFSPYLFLHLDSISLPKY